MDIKKIDCDYYRFVELSKDSNNLSANDLHELLKLHKGLYLCEKIYDWADIVRVKLEDGTYGPNDTITREQLVTILYRYSAKSKFLSISPDYAGLKKFSDENEISEYAKPAMTWACERGIIDGKGNGILDPQGFATRAEVAKIILNYMNLKEK